MVWTSSSTRRAFRKKFLVQKPRGLCTGRVQHVGPEHFGIVSVDCAKARSKFMLADFYTVAVLRLPFAAERSQRWSFVAAQCGRCG